MKLIDKLLMKAENVRNSWIADICLVFYDADLEKWIARVSATNDPARETLYSEEPFEDMDLAIQFCEQFIERYNADATIIINDIMPGGDAYDKVAAEDVHANGG